MAVGEHIVLIRSLASSGDPLDDALTSLIVGYPTGAVRILSLASGESAPAELVEIVGSANHVDFLQVTFPAPLYTQLLSQLTKTFRSVAAGLTR